MTDRVEELAQHLKPRIARRLRVPLIGIAGKLHPEDSVLAASQVSMGAGNFGAAAVLQDRIVVEIRMGSSDRFAWGEYRYRDLLVAPKAHGGSLLLLTDKGQQVELGVSKEFAAVAERQAADGRSGSSSG
jgi:hypothetical protein